MNYTQSQKSEARFTTELESFLSKPEIAKVIALVHQYYFNPNEAIAQVWSFDDFSHLAPADISYEDSMKALAYLEDCEAFESDSEYLAMEHYFEEHNAKIDLPLAYPDNNYLAMRLGLSTCTPGSGTEGFLSDRLTDWDREYLNSRYANYL